MSDAPRALLFDVFGTLVDWRSGVARDVRAALEPLGHELDWSAFADAWRAEYQPALEQVRSGRASFEKLDVLHRRNLERILPRFGVQTLGSDLLDTLERAWHRLDAWPDSAPGLARLRRKFIVAPVSNGNISLLVALARRNGLVWDAVLGAELARAFKPAPRVYLAAIEALDLAPPECVMVAAHAGDLAAAAALGLRTAFIVRPDEHGPGKGSPPPEFSVDWTANGVEQLAERLGA